MAAYLERTRPWPASAPPGMLPLENEGEAGGGPPPVTVEPAAGSLSWGCRENNSGGRTLPLPLFWAAPAAMLGRIMVLHVLEPLEPTEQTRMYQIVQVH